MIGMKGDETYAGSANDAAGIFGNHAVFRLWSGDDEEDSGMFGMRLLLWHNGNILQGLRCSPSQ